jgi:hypothetical protein
MNYIDFSLGKIRESVAKDKINADLRIKAIAHNADPENIGNLSVVPEEAVTVILIETTSGGDSRRVKIVDIGDDYIIARGRNSRADEIFSFNHVASWQFVKYDAKEWK